jgi:hypothetical protein
MTNGAEPASTWSGREQVSAPAITLPDGRTVTLIATVTRGKAPFGARARVAPWAVRVEDGGRIQQLRIRDGTALATGALVACELVIGALALWLGRRSGRARIRQGYGKDTVRIR